MARSYHEGADLSLRGFLASVRAMSGLPAVVSLALCLADVPAPVHAVHAAAPASTPASPRVWRCGDNQARYKPTDPDAQKYWRDHVPGFIKADANQRAAILEAAWTSTKDACFLYFLYRANERAGHFIKAYEQARALQAVGPGIPEDAAEYVLQVLEGTRDCDVEVRVEDGLAPVEVRATYEGLADGDDLTGRCSASPCTHTFTGSQQKDLIIKQAVRVGRWTFVAGAGSEFTGDSASPGEAADRRTVMVDHCGAPQVLTLKKATPKPAPTPAAPPPVVAPPAAPATPPAAQPEPAPIAKPPVHDMRRLSNIGLGIGAGLVVGGGVLLGVGAAQWNSVYDADVDECNAAGENGTARCRAGLVGPTRLRGAGAGVFGAGAGLLIPAMALRRTLTTRRAVWLPVVGGVAAAAGVALVVVGATMFNNNYGGDASTPWAERAAGSMHVHTVGAALAGFGVGMLGASLARCLWRGACKSGPRTESAASTLKVAPTRLPGGAGVAFAGRF